MPIDIHEYHRPKINAIARKAGVPEELIEPKSIKYGTRYDFPQNMSWELEENSVMMFNKFRVCMEEKYEEAITQAIADEAEKEGMTTVVVLDKWKIVKALAAATPEDFPDMVKVVRCKDCKYCIPAIADGAEYELCIVDNDVFPVSVQKQHFCSRGAKMDKEE